MNIIKLGLTFTFLLIIGISCEKGSIVSEINFLDFRGIKVEYLIPIKEVLNQDFIKSPNSTIGANL